MLPASPFPPSRMPPKRRLAMGSPLASPRTVKITKMIYQSHLLRMPWVPPPVPVMHPERAAAILSPTAAASAASAMELRAAHFSAAMATGASYHEANAYATGFIEHAVATGALMASPAARRIVDPPNRPGLRPRSVRTSAADAERVLADPRTVVIPAPSAPAASRPAPPRRPPPSLPAPPLPPPPPPQPQPPRAARQPGPRQQPPRMVPVVPVISPRSPSRRSNRGRGGVRFRKRAQTAARRAGASSAPAAAAAGSAAAADDDDVEADAVVEPFVGVPMPKSTRLVRFVRRPVDFDERPADPGGLSPETIQWMDLIDPCRLASKIAEQRSQRPASRIVPNDAKEAWKREMQTVLEPLSDPSIRDQAAQSRAYTRATLGLLLLPNDLLAVKDRKPREAETVARMAAAKLKEKNTMEALQKELEKTVGPMPSSSAEGDGTDGLVVDPMDDDDDYAMPHQPLSDQQAAQVSKMAGMNDLSRAGKVLRAQDGGVTPVYDQAARDQLRKLHPQLAWIFDAAPPKIELPAGTPRPARATEEEVAKEVHKLKDTIAPGLDSLTPDMLKAAIKNSGNLAALTTLINDIITGNIDSEMRALLTAGRLVPLPKKFTVVDGVATNVQWRPVVCGNILVKIASKIALARVMAALSAHLRSIQRGVGVKGGAESVIHNVQAMLELNPTWICLKTDFTNAFNSMSREVMLTELFKIKELAPIWPIVHFLYSQPSLLYVFDKGLLRDVIVSAIGARQGDPFGSALFCNGIQSFFKDAMAACIVQVRLICDDGTFVGEPADVARVLEWMVANSKMRTGLELRADKCAILYPRHGQAQNAEITALQAKHQFKIHVGSMPLLGSVIGLDDTQRRQFVLDKVNLVSQTLLKLEHQDISLQLAANLMRISVTPRLTYLFRTLPPHVCIDGATLLRTRIIRAFCKKMVLPAAGPASDLEAQLFLPETMAGLGVSDPVGTLHAAYYASLATVVCDLNVTSFASTSEGVRMSERNLWADVIKAARLPPVPAPPGMRVFVPMGLALQQCIDVFSRDGIAGFANTAGGFVAMSLEEFGTLFVLAEPPDKVQSVISGAMGVILFRSLLERHGGDLSADVAAYVRIQCSTHKFASLWLHALPTSPGSTLSNTEFRTALCMLTGEEVYPINANDPPIRCIHANHCKACRHVDLRLEPFHALSCTHETKSVLGRYGQHEHVLKRLCDLARMCQVAWSIDTGSYVNAGQRRPDLRLDFHRRVDETLVDVVGTHPTSKSYLADNKADSWAATNAAVTAKHKKYADIAIDHAIPIKAFAFETYGGLHPEAVKLVESVIRHHRGQAGTDQHAPLFQKLTELVVSIMRDNARMVARAHNRAVANM